MNRSIDLTTLAIVVVQPLSQLNGFLNHIRLDPKPRDLESLIAFTKFSADFYPYGPS